MRYLHTIFIILFFALSVFFSFGVKETFANTYLTQVSPDSSSEKVKKLQGVFNGLGLYNGEINGDFSSIKDVLIDYQLNNGIISDREDKEAGYFGSKTIKSLKQNYGADFERLQEEHLKLEEPKVNEEVYFKVTAYYTPLPNQKKYSTGSYEAEKKLNGGGNTASGKKPTAGTLAAPKNYSFGTKIYLEGVGVLVVEDRGGAIVNSGDKGNSYDRLDIWMGYGDEGRERTRAWGVKTVKGNVLDKTAEVKVNFVVTPKEEILALQEKNSENVEQKVENNESTEKIEEQKVSTNIEKSNKSEIDDYKNLYVSASSPKEESVKKLQELFKKVKLYSGEIDGKYDSIKNILIDFQVENGVISSRQSLEAGYFGKKTFETFSKKFGKNFEFVVEKQFVQNKNEILTLKEKEKIHKIKENYLARVRKNYSGNSLETYINNSKRDFRKVAQTVDSEKKKAILNYFIEIL